MPDLNSVPPSPRHLYQGPDQGHQSAILQMPPPPLPSASTSSTCPLQSAGSRPISNRQTVELARHGSTTIQTSRDAATSPGDSLSLDRDGRSGYFANRGTAQGSRPNPVLSRDAGLAVGPGPSRLPRPMTAAELHSELEQEQEAMVIFLSRELQTLRHAHNSSVLSNSSSASNSVSGTESANLSTRRRRPSTGHYRTQSNTSSSNLATRPPITMADQSVSAPVITRNQARPHAGSISATSSTASLTSGQIMTPSSGSSRVVNRWAEVPQPDEDVDFEAPPHMQGHYTGPYPLPSLTGTAPPPINSPVGPYSLSRSGSRRSTSSSSTPHHMQHQYPRQHAPQRQYSNRWSSSSLAASAVTTPATSEPSPALLPATPRFEEVAAHRRAYEAVKRENETLKNRIIELEKSLHQRRESDAIGVPEEELRVGESAASAGV